MTDAELKAWLKRGTKALKSGLPVWSKRKAFPAVAAAAIVAFTTLASACQPPENIDPADWAQKYRYLSPDSGSPHPGKWDNATTPYLVEPMRRLGPDDPCEGVVLKMSAQVGKTEVGVNWFGYIGHIERLPMLITQAGIVELGKFNRFKLQPTIDATPALSAAIRPESDKSGKGSTTLFKDWPGGGCVLASANASSALQGISRARYWGDEVSEYPAEAGSRGDPVEQAITRMESWASLSKYLLTSTCQYKGSCRITLAYEKSDQRKYYVPCLHCGDYQILEFDGLHWSKSDTGLKVPAYSCAACGADIYERDKKAMVAAGVWVPTFKSKNPNNPQPPTVIPAQDINAWRVRDCEGLRVRGYHLWKIYSNLAEWDSILIKHAEAEGDPEALKVFWQQTLAEAWDDSGEAPDFADLAKQTESYPDKQIPPGAYLTTGAVDVQKNRLEWGVYAWGPNLQGWLIDKGILEGETDQIEVWDQLRQLMRSAAYPYPNGKTFPVDLWGVDTGYRSPIVYQATKGLPNVLNLDGHGRDKPHAPPLSSPISSRKKFGKVTLGLVTKYDVGTYGLKTRMYGFLKAWQSGPDETGSWPRGVLHFNKIADEEFFAQLTAEVLVPRTRRGGRVDYYWEKTRKSNEHHDICLYAMALACHLRWDSRKPEQWRDLIAERGGAPEKEQASLEDLWTPAAPRPEGVSESEVIPQTNPRARLLEQLAQLNRNLEEAP